MTFAHMLNRHEYRANAKAHALVWFHDTSNTVRDVEDKVTKQFPLLDQSQVRGIVGNVARSLDIY